MNRKIFLATVCFFAFYLSGYLVFFAPLPFLYLSFQRDNRSWLAVLALVFILTLFFYFFWIPQRVLGPDLDAVLFFGLGYFLYLLLLAFLMSLSFWSGWTLFRLGLTSSLTATAFAVLFALLSQQLGWYDVQGFLDRTLTESLGLMEKMIQAPSFKGDRMEGALLLTQAKAWLPVFPWLLPSILFGLSLGVIALNMALLWFLRRSLLSHPWPFSFRSLKVPSSFVWILIGSGLLYFVLSPLFSSFGLKMAAVNLLIMALLVYFFQGLSIVAFFLKRSSFLFRFGIYGVLLLFFQILSLAVAGLGLADIWFDFRRLEKKERLWKSF